jgi:hypothetical protein
MAKIEVAGQPCLNVSMGKTSYLIVKSDMDGTFDASSKVSKVADGTYTLEWSGEKHWVNGKGNRLKARLKTDKGKGKDDKDTLDTGSVTVTVTSPDKTIMNVPVDYITDPT